VLWQRSMGYLEAIPEALTPTLSQREGGPLSWTPSADAVAGRGGGGHRHVLGGRRSPPQERGTPVKTGAKRREQTQVTPLDAAFLERLMQENGH
jgi:hypothetical protein